jgi:hypothetical protein
VGGEFDLSEGALAEGLFWIAYGCTNEIAADLLLLRLGGTALVYELFIRCHCDKLEYNDYDYIHEKRLKAAN